MAEEASEMPKSSEPSQSQEDYYKSLVTDDEVVAALLKDSKRRDGTLPPERMKPNINFLQRTVSSLVSKNTRIDESQDSFKSTYTKENQIELQVLQQIRLENEAASSKKADIDFEFEKDMFLKTSAINFQKSNEEYITVKNNDAVATASKLQTSPKTILETNKKSNIIEKGLTNKERKDQGATKRVLTKEFLKKELEKINNKIESVHSKNQQNVPTSSNKTVKNKSKHKEKNNHKKPFSSQNEVSSTNLSKEEMLRLELASLNAKIQEKLSKIKTEDSILILDKEDSESEVEIVTLDSSDEKSSRKSKIRNKTKSNKIKILQDIQITNETISENAIRKRMLSRIKENQLELNSETNIGVQLNDFVCTKCGSCNSNQMVDRKPCTAIKCETIELSSCSSSDLELVSVKIEPKTKKRKKIKKLNKQKKDKTLKSRQERTCSRDTKGSRDYSSSSDNERSRSWDTERDERDRQREHTYKTRKESFKSTIRNRTKSRDSRERTTSRERRAIFREKDNERSPSKDRRARSFSRFSTGASYERYIKHRNKSKSRSRSDSRDSRKQRSRSKDSRDRESSTDSEQERYQAHLLAQQRFEERARREYWMNRIIREYQNRYRIPRIPQRHRLVERRKNEPPSVQSKVVVVPKRERNSSSDSSRSESRARGRSSDSSSSKNSKKRDSSSDKTPDFDRYNLDILTNEGKTQVEPDVASDKIVDENKESSENAEKVDDSIKVHLENGTDDIASVNDNSEGKYPQKRPSTSNNNQSLEEGEVSDGDKEVRKKKKKIKKKTKKEKKEKDKYVWKQVEIASNVTLHLGTEYN